MNGRTWSIRPIPYLITCRYIWLSLKPGIKSYVYSCTWNKQLDCYRSLTYRQKRFYNSLPRRELSFTWLESCNRFSTVTIDSASAFLYGFANIRWIIHSRTFNLVVFSTIKGQSYPKSLKLNWMSRAKDFQHKANAFKRFI